MIDRRQFIRAGLAIAAAPFIVRASSLMMHMPGALAETDSTGVFFVGEFERLDPTMHEPLAAVTWFRGSLAEAMQVPESMLFAPHRLIPGTKKGPATR